MLLSPPPPPKERTQMSIGILVIGATGSGKSTSIRTLDPTTTVIISPDGKPLPWKGASKDYIKGKNLFYVSKIDGAPRIGADGRKEVPIIELMKRISDNSDKKIKNIILDTVNTALIDLEMSETFRLRKAGGEAMQKWWDLACEGWGIFKLANALREDIIVWILAHSTEKIDSDTATYRKMITNGRKLEKLVPESMFSIVIHTVKALDSNDKIEHYFVTEDIDSTAKAPMEMFPEIKMPNDMGIIEKHVREYYEGEIDE